jgi:hypothetical protein
MCLICIEFEKERMNITEANRALGEMIEVIGPKHAAEVKEMLREAAESIEHATEDDSSD